VPADLEQVVLRCLEKKAENRYPTVRAMGEALAACAAADEWGPNRAESCGSRSPSRPLGKADFRPVLRRRPGEDTARSFHDHDHEIESNPDR